MDSQARQYHERHRYPVRIQSAILRTFVSGDLPARPRHRVVGRRRTPIPGLSVKRALRTTTSSIMKQPRASLTEDAIDAPFPISSCVLADGAKQYFKQMGDRVIGWSTLWGFRQPSPGLFQPVEESSR